MIRVICPHCGSTLNAKTSLIGQVRKCPKCGNPVEIIAPSVPPPQPASAASQSPDVPSSIPLETETAHVSIHEHLPVTNLPLRLNRESHYLICDRARVVATWENNGSGWMFRVGNGFVSARRAKESLPNQGDFKLVEMRFNVSPDAKHLVGLTFYQFAPRWALTSLDQDEDHVLSKLIGPASLNRDQKNAVRQVLRDHLMREVWGNATEVLEYLGNADSHSQSVG
jgi:hypothetical protein